jgi:hypothetical protein
MEDIRNYRIEEEQQEQRREDDDRVEFGASQNDEDVPFYIPRD